MQTDHLSFQFQVKQQINFWEAILASPIDTKYSNQNENKITSDYQSI